MSGAGDDVARLSDFDVQTRLWGWTVWGCEPPSEGVRNPAVLLESPGLFNTSNGWWDRRWIDLLDTHRYHGDVEVDVPQWWALACAPDIAIAGLENR